MQSQRHFALSVQLQNCWDKLDFLNKYSFQNRLVMAEVSPSFSFLSKLTTHVKLKKVLASAVFLQKIDLMKNEVIFCTALKTLKMDSKI